MSNVGMRGLPSVPSASAFPEVNVRTYVVAGGKPGVWFFSLDAGSRLAAAAARAALNLPYHAAAMAVSSDGAAIRYASRRRQGPPAALALTYRPAGGGTPARKGSLDWFLTERYCLYGVTRKGRLYRLEIHHSPWVLESCAAEFAENTMLPDVGIAPREPPPLLHFARRQDVVAWRPRVC
jgi:uncharacterized protein YqjF (DUF2071 family)